MDEEELQSIPLNDLPPLTFEANGDSADLREANLQAVMPSPGYPHTVILMADAISKRADIVLMDFNQAAATVRYQVDGIWFNMPTLTRVVGDYMVASLKQLAGLDYRERRQRQVGKFKSEYLKTKFKCELTAQGVATGERIAITIDRPKPPLENLEQIGMRTQMQEQLVKIMNEPGTLTLFSALPGDGLSTTWRAAFQTTDRFMRDFVVIEDKAQSEPEIINVESIKFDKSAGQTLEETLRSVLLREPNVVAFPEIPDGKTLDLLVDLTNSNELTTMTRLPAKHAIEAVLRALMLKPNVEGFARALDAVVGQRIIRLLCQHCRLPYEPNPRLLSQLGLPSERVPVLYRHFQPSQEQLSGQHELEPCENCGGPGYFERTGIFEVLLVDDRFRQAMQDPQPTLQKLADAATQSGHISLRDEGIVMVARGDTSLDELQRVLKK